MTKPANLTHTILHGITLVLGGLMLGFLALPFFVEKMAGVSVTQSGYDFLDFTVPNPTSEMVFAGVGVLLVVIAASLLVIASVLALLGDFGVISNETYAKIVKWTLVCAAVFALVATIISMVASINFASSIVKSVGGKKVVEAAGLTITAGWANIILNLVCGLGAAGCVGYTLFAKKGE